MPFKALSVLSYTTACTHTYTHTNKRINIFFSHCVFYNKRTKSFRFVCNGEENATNSSSHEETRVQQVRGILSTQHTHCFYLSRCSSKTGGKKTTLKPFVPIGKSFIPSHQHVSLHSENVDVRDETACPGIAPSLFVNYYTTDHKHSAYFKYTYTRYQNI